MKSFLFLLFCTTTAFAQTTNSLSTTVLPRNPLYINKKQIEVGLHTANFDYVEPGLMKDNGRLSGLIVKGYFPLAAPATLLRGDFEYLSGSGIYDGAFQDGTPLVSETQNRISNVRVLYGNQFVFENDSHAITYSGLGFRNLTNTQSGPGSYKREISYTYLPLGAEWSKQVSKKIIVGAGVEYDLFLSGTVKTHLSDVDSRLPDIENRQRSGTGYKVSAKFQWMLDSVTISLEPFYQSWKVADSDMKQVVADSKIYGFYEPENETKITGANLVVAF